MRAFLAGLLALAGIAAGLFLATVTGMAQDEIRSRLGKLPLTLIGLAALRPSRTLRDRLGDDWDEQVDEWKAEVAGILHVHEDVPITGLVKALWFALGIVASSPAVARALSGTTSRAWSRVSASLARLREKTGKILMQARRGDLPGPIVFGGQRTGSAIVGRSVAVTLALAAVLTATAVIPTLQPSGTPGAHTGISGADRPPAAKPVAPTQQDNYLVAYKGMFTMPGDSCQDPVGASSSVKFTQWMPEVTVGNVDDADMDVDCGLGAPALGFNDRTARVTGSSSATGCAATTDLMPIGDLIDLRQLAKGDELCLIAGGRSTPKFVVLATLVASAGPPTYNTTWNVTMWQTSPQTTTRHLSAGPRHQLSMT